MSAHDTESRDLAGAVFDLWSAAGKKTELTVNGWSMRPLIDYGDTVLLDHAARDIRPGAIVAFRRGNKIVVHRVLRRRRVGDEWVYVSRGDATVRHDPPVRQHAVIGEVLSLRKQGATAWTDLRGARWRALGTLMLLRDMLQSITPLPRLGGNAALRRIVALMLGGQR